MLTTKTYIIGICPIINLTVALRPSDSGVKRKGTSALANLTAHGRSDRNPEAGNSLQYDRVERWLLRHKHKNRVFSIGTERTCALQTAYFWRAHRAGKSILSDSSTLFHDLESGEDGTSATRYGISERLSSLLTQLPLDSILCYCQRASCSTNRMSYQQIILAQIQANRFDATLVNLLELDVAKGSG